MASRRTNTMLDDPRYSKDIWTDTYIRDKIYTYAKYCPVKIWLRCPDLINKETLLKPKEFFGTRAWGYLEQLSTFKPIPERNQSFVDRNPDWMILWDLDASNYITFRTADVAEFSLTDYHGTLYFL